MPLPRHIPALDGLRGVAITMVVLTHSWGGWQAAMSIYQNTLTWPATFHLPAWLTKISGLAYHGVTLFFVISAFTLMLSLAPGFNLRDYALRRAARVAPGYWASGIVYSLLAGAQARLWAPEGVSLPDFAAAASFLSAWQGGASLAVVPGGWSVSCEVAFYVALPGLFWIVRGRILRAAGLAFLVAFAVQLYARHVMAIGQWQYVPDFIHPAVQAPAFLFGMLGAVIVMRYRLPRLPGLTYALLLAGILVLPIAPIAPWRMLPHVLFALIAAAAVALAAQHEPWVLCHRITRRIGEVSFSLYLWHFALLAPCMWLAERVFPSLGVRTFAPHFVLTLTSSFAVACLSYRWLELPAIWWARRLRTHMGAPAVVANR